MKKHLEYFENSAGLSRRALLRIAAGGAAAVAMLGKIRAANALAADAAPGIKICGQASLNPSDDDLKFLNEVGYNYVYGLGGLGQNGEMPTVEQLKAAKKRFADAGIVLDNVRYLIGGKGGYDINTLLLGLPGADAALERVKAWIRVTGKKGAGFDYTGARTMVTGVWESGIADARGGSMTRDFNPDSPNVHGSDYLNGLDPKTPKPAGGLNSLYWGREYSYDEVMANFKKYVAQGLVPTLEENNVFLAFHPDDPPVFEKLGGVARIMCNYKEYKHMFEVANSPYIGIQMCCGTWNEGGNLMGADLMKVLDEFYRMKKYREIHFRNISSPPVNGKPHFNETFQDVGYYDMYKIMKKLVDIGFNGLVHLDHTPKLVGAPYAYAAYASGFMHACLKRAEAEPKGAL